MFEFVIWFSLLAIVYAYFGYPFVLMMWSSVNKISVGNGYDEQDLPSISVLIPCYNEATILKDKIKNTLELEYPSDRVEIIFLSDGSTDDTVEIFNGFPVAEHITMVSLEGRKGKANALNEGLNRAKNDIVVFSDASIILEKDALLSIVQRFSDKRIGCISGEDHIAGGGGEGLYGQYELFLRNKESQVSSIVGASGSFYAQRRNIIEQFKEGYAPDFLSVLNTIEKGYRVITEPKARGSMLALKSASDEFKRKTRTVLRGMATLWFKRSLFNPFKYTSFSFILFSHKIMRWLVPFFMILVFSFNSMLIGDPVYLFLFALQLLFYCAALLAWWDLAFVKNHIFGKIALYFCISNLAILQAWVQFFKGGRQELWEPSKRESK